MAGLFLLFSLAMGAIAWQRRLLAVFLLCAGIALSLVMFWYHVTDSLQIHL